MIFDIVKNLGKYREIPNLEKIADFIENQNFLKLPNGKIEIDGENLFANVSRYSPKPVEEKDFETHDDYADVHLLVRGVEKMQTMDENGKISEIIAKENDFAVFFVGEAHKPGCLYQNLTEPILKIVFKTK